MEFTPEQEQELIEKNMPKIYRAVDNYAARHSSSVARVPHEDFVQEVAIAFLNGLALWMQCATLFASINQ